MKNWPLCHVFIFGDIGQKNVFYNILERKNAFLGYKNKKFKISKNWGFSKWVSLCFVQKWATSPSFFIFGNIGQEKFFLRYSGSKKRCFLEFVRLYFCRLHCTFFYSENQIKIFSGLICPKSHLKNKIPFFDKKRGQEPIKWSLHLPYKPLESTLSRVDL